MANTSLKTILIDNVLLSVINHFGPFTEYLFSYKSGIDKKCILQLQRNGEAFILRKRGSGCGYGGSGLVYTITLSKSRKHVLI